MNSSRDDDTDQWRCIDREHAHMYTLVKKFNTVLREGAERDRLLLVLEEIIDRSQQHFATEERALRDIDPPGYQFQQAAHRQIADELTLFYCFLVSSRSVTRDQCIHAMDALLVHHIKDDPNYFPLETAHSQRA